MRAFCWHFAAVVMLASWANLAPANEQFRFPWQPNVEAAQRLAAQTNRLVLIHFWAPYCKPCLQMDVDVFGQPETARALEGNFVMVKLNTEEAPGTARMYGVQRLPSDVIITPTGRVIAQLSSPQAANQYVGQLNQVVDGYRNQNQNVYTQFSNPSNPNAVSTGVPMATQPEVQRQFATPLNQTPVVAYSENQEQLRPGQQHVAAGPGFQQQLSQQQSVQQPAMQRPTAQQPVAHQTAMQQPSMEQPAGTVGPPAWAANVGTSSAESGADIAAASGVQGAADASAFGPAANQQAHETWTQQPGLNSARPSPGTQAPAAQSSNSGGIAAHGVQIPPGNPPLALDGYCPVTLNEQGRWGLGDVRWGAIHRGRTYLFGGPDEQKKFLANPDAYSPMLSGDDPVLALDRGQAVPGRREHGVYHENRIYLFSSEETLQAFSQNPQRYTTQVLQAMRPTGQRTN